MKYHIITYGCQMNKADSERIAAALEKKGYQPASSIDKANLIVVNMCSVRQSAVDRIFGLSQKFSKLKTQNPKLKTILTGCILKKDEKKFRKIFNDVRRKSWFFSRVKSHLIKSNLIPISYGCNNLCTYCVVPQTRGKLVCRDHKEILREAKNTIKQGSEELWLLGQNVNDYQSPADPSVNFAKLLKQVSQLPGKFRIRFTSPHPKNFTNELIETIAGSPKIAKFIHLPVQSGDDQILKKMNRNYTAKQYKNLVKKIRKRIPDVNLSTDVIVGFPGETEKQFENTVKLFKEIKFNMAYIAKYSPRPGTPASQLKDTVPLKEKKRREKILREILNNKPPT